MQMRHPDNFSHSFARLNGIDLHYVREGKGDPIVLVHGWPGFWWEWNQIIGPLAENFDVIAIDMRGFGDSEKPDLSDIRQYSTNNVVEDISELLDELGLESSNFVGHDYGSIVLHKFIRKYKSKVKHAVILNPVVPGFDERYTSSEHIGESWYALFHQLDMAVDLVSSGREACQAYYSHFLIHWTAKKEPLVAEEIEIYIDNYLNPGNVHGGFNFYRAGRLGTWNNLDYTISDCPVTFLQGLDDPCVPSSWTDLVTHWYTNYSIEYVSQCGHFMMREQPELLIDRIRRACG